MKIQPLGDRVLVEPLKEEEVSKGGIIIPDTAKEKPQQGKVIALGTGKLDDDGKKIPFNVKKGDMTKNIKSCVRMTFLGLSSKKSVTL